MIPSCYAQHGGFVFYMVQACLAPLYLILIVISDLLDEPDESLSRPFSLIQSNFNDPLTKLCFYDLYKRNTTGEINL